MHEDLLDAVAEAVRGARPGQGLAVRGGGTKSALWQGGTAVVEVGRLAGILRYEPQEFTFTALAGTPVTDVVAALAAHGQYLPFDPPLAVAGATLGGTVAAGLSGPGRLRYGGVRDFLLAVTYVDGCGQRLRGGAPVVKSSAGFDLPKLMVGSLGRLAVLVELTFKVFPRPPAWRTGRFEVTGAAAARQALTRLTTRPFDLEGLEWQPPDRLWLRLGGPHESLGPRLQRIAQELGAEPAEELCGEAEAGVWSFLREFTWTRPQDALVKVPLLPSGLETLEAALSGLAGQRCYGAGGTVAWISLPASRLAALDERLGRLELPGLLLRCGAEKPAPDSSPSPAEAAPLGPLLGRQRGTSFLQRLRGVLDPDDRFLPFEGRRPASPRA